MLAGERRGSEQRKTGQERRGDHGGEVNADRLSCPHEKAGEAG